MGTPFIFTMMTGTLLTVRAEPVISLESCMILLIEVLNTRIVGPTLSKAREETNHITRYNLCTASISLEELSESSEAIYSIYW